MKACFLNPPFTPLFSRTSRWPETSKSGTFYYPFWLAYATGVLEKEGFETELIDAPADGLSLDHAGAVVERFDPELLVVETSTPSIYNDLRVVEGIKKRLPDVKTVLVGPHVSVLPEESLRLSPSIDIVARKEYDYTVLDIARRLEIGSDDFSRVSGISWREENAIRHNPDRPLIDDLDAIPFVSGVYKRHLDIDVYYYTIAFHPMVQVFTSRGCPSRCTFCLWPQTFMGRKFRARSAENVVDEMEYIVSDLPRVQEIFFEDDTFTINKRRIVEICELIVSRGIDIPWSANARGDISRDVLLALKRAGCRLLVIGYESGNQGILNNIKKGMTLEMFRKFTRNCKKLGIKLHACFMVGLPGETPETIRETVRFAEELNTDMVQFQVAVPFPGTEFYQWCEDNRYLLTRDPGQWVDDFGILDCLVDYPQLTRDYLKAMADRATVRYYLRPRYVVLAIRQFLEDRREMKRFLRSASNYLRYLIFKRTP